MAAICWWRASKKLELDGLKYELSCIIEIMPYSIPFLLITFAILAYKGILYGESKSYSHLTKQETWKWQFITELYDY